MGKKNQRGRSGGFGNKKIDRTMRRSGRGDELFDADDTVEVVDTEDYTAYLPKGGRRAVFAEGKGTLEEPECPEWMSFVPEPDSWQTYRSRLENGLRRSEFGRGGRVGIREAPERVTTEMRDPLFFDFGELSVTNDCREMFLEHHLSVNGLAGGPGDFSEEEVRKMTNKLIEGAFFRHIRGDYGGVPPDQIERNKKALGDGGWIISSYHCGETRFLVATNPARTETVVTLPTPKEK